MSSKRIIDKPITWNAEREALSLKYLKERHGLEKEAPSITPQMVVVHWTAISTVEVTFDVFNPTTLGGRADLTGASNLNVSSQFLIDRDGTIFRLLPDTTFARHVIGLNYLAIGIENVGGPDAPLTKAQLDANEQLIRYLKRKYPIDYVIGHHEIPREFRGVWIATVANIDWPASGLDSYEKQKKDFIAILDYYKKLNFNAVIVQIRTAGDAFYPSKYAPWSKYLTGKEGQAPQTQENPLTWMIQEAHSRGLEFHAWLNPYRATFDLKTDLLSPNHDFHKHRDWMVKYGPKYYYNPGLPEVKNHLTAVIKEIVDNYDIDAIHFDDYFYPYKIAKETFPDQTTYNKFKNQGQTQDDWRRQNVNDLIQAVHTTIKTSKPWVQFGISPFGVWRNQAMDPKGSPTRAGQTNYDDLYADPMTWMKNGWIDYLIPQVYWSMEHPLASYRNSTIGGQIIAMVPISTSGMVPIK
ncbi:hypothetical protein GHT06_004004 [Daphnia sinensis]|uniref:N-acetylmuramoyl-L-alanine amidase domain-containing protein n=1 Tax=Daphnia sinensis TaxID=1820382 RepID=A0AAD5KTY9_9CRUS|nr:hypothetical protein GHT06_004004 [Daphnia sinensis]